MNQGINFGDGVPWLAINQRERKRLAKDVDQSKGEVVVLLARRPRSCARCGEKSHHPFDCRERHAAPWE